ncbi:serine carboxypeptidase II-2 [Cinnamomum micranthum f. kanehirae]|uniref:Carboxypeptidase n=1 Tax=Cinnamomum micranthum f. kanehirae TaxID=337451 RepID=A0A3S3M1L5_9MAGN|nr:serine carboxypeptidase II-2 [Cinnamomum micranthum f. kanehirae]
MEKMDRFGTVFLSVAYFFLLSSPRVNCSSSWIDFDYATDQQEKDRVHNLPGQPSNVNFAHYSGYVTVNKDSGRALFYWFFEAVGDPSSKPLVLWINGGPGCSSIGYGVAKEIGPFHVNPDGKTLYLNPYSWNKVANVIFLDSPIGTGFSYSNNTQDLLSNGDERTATDSLEFLKKWLERFPQYKGRDFYIVGESYAGHFVTQLVQRIVTSNIGENSINLKGFMLGNPLIDDFHGHLGVFQFMWTNGLISDETFKLLNIFCANESFEHIPPSCQKILDIATEEHGNIDEFSIFAPLCPSNVGLSNRLFKRLFSVRHVGEENDPCVDNYSTVYYNLPEVQRALHVDPAVAPSKWETCNNAVEDNWQDSAKSVLHIFRELIPSGLHIWIYSGNTDAIMPVVSTRHSIEALKLPSITPWHAWYEDGEVGGWVQGYEGLTLVTVRGAGHQVPLDKPKLALPIIKSFLSGSPMPTLSKLKDS